MLGPERGFEVFFYIEVVENVCLAEAEPCWILGKGRGSRYESHSINARRFQRLDVAARGFG